MKLFLVRLINFHTRTHIVTRIALRSSRRAERKRERERERGRDSLMKRNLIKMGRESVHWFPDLLEPGWQASGLLPGLFQDRRVSRSHTCIINETCHAARAINFDVQIRSDTDPTTLTTKRHTPPPSNFSKRGRNTSCLTPGVRFPAMAPVPFWTDSGLQLSLLRSRPPPLTLIGPQNAATRTRFNLPRERPRILLIIQLSAEDCSIRVYTHGYALLILSIVSKDQLIPCYYIWNVIIVLLRCYYCDILLCYWSVVIFEMTSIR